MNSLPRIIQGGMGVAVSNWRLARAVARAGQLGVVSGTAIDTVMVRRLQDGDPDGAMRRAIEHFPIPGVGLDVLRKFYRPGGRPLAAPYKLLPMYTKGVKPERERITMLANFVEVWLAKEGHDGPIGLNLLTKVQMPNLPSLYGAMLAGVDVVLMGAGIPREIPGALDALAQHRRATLRLDVENAPRDEVTLIEFDPVVHWRPTAPLTRPKFFAVISASSLALTLARKSTGQVDGFVVEGHTAGGHNAPPRGELQLSDSGEPVYGERDIVDLSKLRELGIPFWLAGGFGTPTGLRRARDAGAEGVQVGTVFAFCEESGVAPEIRQKVLASARSGTISIHTDPRASPTGFPFKVVTYEVKARAEETERKRICDLGYLRVAVRAADGKLKYRCAAEPAEDYVSKGGRVEDTVGRRCLCNGLTSTIGFAQTRGESVEPPLVTSGDDVATLRHLATRSPSLNVMDVIEYLGA